MARSAMQHVELDEESAPHDAPPEPARAARRPVRWWWVGGLAAVLVLALVVTQAVLDSRERVAQEQLAGTPGVVRPMGPGAQVLWRPDAAAQGVLRQRIDVGGAIVGLRLDDDGSQSFVAIDQRTGEQRFSTPLVGPDPVRARALDRSVGGTCVPVPGGAGSAGGPTEAACLVSDGFVQYGDEGVRTSRPATSTRVVVLGTDDGRVVAEWSALGATSLTALRGLVVVSIPAGEPGEGVSGRDLRTGEVRWTFRPPLAAPDRRSFAGLVRLFSVEELVGVAVPGWTATVLSETGTVLRAGQPGDADHLVDHVAGRFALLSSTGSGSLRSTLVQRGRDDVDLPGAVLVPTVDDGSAPDLVLTSGGSLRGWDAADGTARWKSDVVASGNAVVLDGRVHVSTRSGVVALDGTTGEVAWRGATTEDRVPGSLATDGEVLLVAERPVAGGAPSDLVAYAATDGRTVWRSGLPDGLRTSIPVGHLLLGWGDDGELAVLG